MPYVIRHEDREWFKRCRRVGLRVPGAPGSGAIAQPTLDIHRAILDALAVCYFPDMWDWAPDIVLPLVLEGFVRSMRKQRGAGKEPAAEEDAPGASAWIWALLVVDEDDRYWIVRQWVAEDPCGDIERAFLDDEAISNCWAWELAYIGMEVEGTVHNELRAAVPPGTERRPEPEPLRATETSRLNDRGIAQHEPTGGGRSIPQHRRCTLTPGRTRAPSASSSKGIGSSAGRRSRGRAKGWRASERGSRGRRWTWSGRA